MGMTKEKKILVVSWVFAILTAVIFLNSLFFKFNPDAVEPVHIFGTIGLWMESAINVKLGKFFASYGQYFIGVCELIVSAIVLAPLIFKEKRAILHAIGAVGASITMLGAIFFHLFTPLGWFPTWCENKIDGKIVEYTKDFQCQGGEVFVNYALANFALAIFVLGVFVIFVNKKILLELVKKS